MKVIGLFIIIGIMAAAGSKALALSELEAELADFQVQLRKDETHRKHGKPVRQRSQPSAPAALTYNPGPAPKLGRVARKKRPAPAPAPAPESIPAHPYEAEPAVTFTEPASPPSPYSQDGDPAADIPSESILVARPNHYSGKSAPFVFRLTALGFATISTFDGSDSKTVTSTVINPYNGGASGSILADFNLGSSKWVLEGGFQSMVAGSYTGYDESYAAFYGDGLSERLTLNYVGVPLSLKYMISGEYRSSFFLKAGVTPSYMYQSEYRTLSGNLIQQNRFGEFSTFDVLLTVGGGFSLRVWDKAHLVIDGGFYQGVMPISKYFDIYNMGFRVGGGFSYIL